MCNAKLYGVPVAIALRRDLTACTSVGIDVLPGLKHTLLLARECSYDPLIVVRQNLWASGSPEGFVCVFIDNGIFPYDMNINLSRRVL